MSTEWSIEWLDALPAGTVIEADMASYPTENEWLIRVADQDDEWGMLSGPDVWSSRELIQEHSGSIRVISAPVEELLRMATIEAASIAVTVEFSAWQGDFRVARAAILAAVNHVIGETP